MKSKIIGLLTGLACLILLGAGLVFAWGNTSQHKTFVSESHAAPSAVTLRKYALDAKGNQTTMRLSGATFRLFKESDQENGAPSQIGTTYVTNQQGEIVIENLAVGRYYFEEMTAPQGYDFVKDTAGQAVTKTPFEIKTGENTDLYLSVYNALLTGDFRIRKAVERSDKAPLSDADKAQTFDFTVRFTQNGKETTDSYTYTVNGRDYSIKSGESLSLKHGEEAVFKDLPQFLHYDVTEKNVAGFVSNGSNTTGDISSTPQIVQFTNVKSMSGLKVTKRVVGATAAQASQDFEFTATFSDGKPYHPLINGQEVKLTQDGKFTLKQDETAYFTEVPNGVSYVIKETTSTDYVADIQTITGTSRTDAVAEYVVTNTFQPIDPNLTGDLKIEKQVLGTAQATDFFTFKVTFDSQKSYDYTITSGSKVGTGRIKSGDTIKLAAGDVVEIKALPLGTTYQVEETDFGAYQPTQTKISGQIIDDAQAAKLMFENIAPLTLTVVKRLAGPVGDTGKTFEFKLSVSGQADQVFKLKANESKTFTLPYGATYQVIETDYQKEGYQLISFEHNQREQVTENITATATNTYFEPEKVTIKGEKTWVGLDATTKLPQKIVVQLLDDADVVIDQKEVQPDSAGKWLYQFTAPKYDTSGKEIVYHVREVALPDYDATVTGYDIVNTYVAPVTFTPEVEKKISGDKPSTDEVFTFDCRSVGQVPVISQTVDLKGAGKASFKALTFSQAGTYVYQIYEKTGLIKGYTYDKTSYTLRIVVEKNGSKLTIKQATYENEQGAISPLAVFTNHYQSQEKPPEPPAPKPPTPPLPSTPAPPTQSSELPKTSDDKPAASDNTLPVTGEFISTVAVLAGLAVITLVYRKWLRERRK